MIKLKNVIAPLLLWCLVSHSLSGQESTMPANDQHIQPTIMVIPYTPKGRSVRQSYEQSDLVRVAITEVKQGFDDRGVNTIDLRAKLKQMNNTALLEEDQKSDMKDEVVRLSGADIYVEVETKQNKSTSGNSVTVIMTAYDAFSGESYANKVANSQKFHTTDYGRLVKKTVGLEIDNFLNTINAKFTDLLENGRTIILNVGVDENSDLDLDTEVGSDNALLSDNLEDWVYENSYKNYYHIQGTTSNRMIFDQVKVPLRDERGRNFRLSSFAARLRNHIGSLGIECSRLVNGNQIIITIE